MQKETKHRGFKDKDTYRKTYSYERVPIVIPLYAKTKTKNCPITPMISEEQAFLLVKHCSRSARDTFYKGI